MKIKELLATKDTWTQGVLARTKDGTPCGTSDPNATRWCLRGAAVKCYDDNVERMGVYDKIRDAMEPKWRLYSLIEFNDCATFREIKKVLEIADI